jgi:hypothetical protein
MLCDAQTTSKFQSSSFKSQSPLAPSSTHPQTTGQHQFPAETRNISAGYGTTITFHAFDYSQLFYCFKWIVQRISRGSSLSVRQTLHGETACIHAVRARSTLTRSKATPKVYGHPACWRSERDPHPGTRNDRHALAIRERERRAEHGAHLAVPAPPLAWHGHERALCGVAAGSAWTHFARRVSASTSAPAAAPALRPSFVALRSVGSHFSLPRSFLPPRPLGSAAPASVPTVPAAAYFSRVRATGPQRTVSALAISTMSARTSSRWLCGPVCLEELDDARLSRVEAEAAEEERERGRLLLRREHALREACLRVQQPATAAERFRPGTAAGLPAKLLPVGRLHLHDHGAEGRQGQGRIGIKTHHLCERRS